MKRIALIFISLCASVLSITAQVDSVEQQRNAYTKAKQFVKKGMPPVPDASSFLPEPPAEGDDVYTIIITNSNGVALPNTGGPGTIMYTLSGLLVLIASAVMYGFRRRHEERRAA